MTAKPQHDCIFCKIASGEIPSEIVYKDEMVTAFKDLSPVAPVHILIIPNEHVTNLSECDEGQAETLAHILLVAPKIAKEQGVYESGYRVVTNNGKDAGQTVFHLHFHLIGGRHLHFRNQ